MRFLAVLCLAAVAQGQTFEVASVKVAAPQPNGRNMMFMRGGPGSSDPGQITYTGISMMNLLMRAYDLKSGYQVNGPAWLNSERYDIVAKIAPGTSKEDFSIMLQNLLTERFHVAMHRETKEMQGYELVVGKNGSKLKESSAEDVAAATAPPSGAPPPPGPPKMDANGRPKLDRPGMMMRAKSGDKGMILDMTARAVEVSGLAGMLSSQMQQPVVDKTGLKGRFDFDLEFSPEGAGFGGMGAPPPSGGRAQTPLDGLSEPGQTLQSAVQAQLGLKLEPKKTKVDVVVIEALEKIPTEN